MKLLFVDDEPSILRAYERQFRKYFNVHTAQSAQEGLAAITGESYKAIVSDMRMPGMNGLEFLAKAREISPDSIQILLTGNPAMATDAKDPGYFRCLQKPCPRDHLLAVLKEAMEIPVATDGDAWRTAIDSSE